MAMIEVKSVEVTENSILIEALNIEEILMADDLYEDVEVPEVKYQFSRTARNGAEMRYLWKVVSSNKKCQTAKSMGAKLNMLIGGITQLSDSFLVKE